MLSKKRKLDEDSLSLTEKESNYFQNAFKYRSQNINYTSLLYKMCTVPYDMDYYSRKLQKNIKYVQTFNGIIKEIDVSNKQVLVEFLDTNQEEMVPFRSIYPLQEQIKYYKANSYLSKEIRNPIIEDQEYISFVENEKKKIEEEKHFQSMKRQKTTQEVIQILTKLHLRKLDNNNYLLFTK